MDPTSPAAPRPSHLPLLYAITDRRLAGGMAHAEIVSLLVRGGCRLVQLREKSLPDGELLQQASAAAAAAHAAGARLIVNDRPDVVALAGADGVHLGDEDLPAAMARGILGATALVGRSAHSVPEAIEASREPVDYVALGPIYATTHAARRREPLGIEALASAAAAIRLPLVAIGGIDPARAREALAAGAASVAVMGDLMTATDIAARAAAYLELSGPSK